MNVVEKLKCGKALRLDVDSVKVTEKGGKAVKEWHVRLCIMSVKKGIRLLTRREQLLCLFIREKALFTF